MPVLDRFLRYVQIDTQSDPGSTSIPSTEKQKDLGRLLVSELLAMGYADAEMDAYGNIYATIPATAGLEEEPVICLCAHMDTSPDCSGAGVRPMIHPAWDGRDITLPDDSDVVLSINDEPGLAAQVGHDLVTASGLTLLGADNKAGVAEIMQLAEELAQRTDIAHGRIRLLFTCDEEIGRGADHVDLERLGADYGYTLDGETVGTLETETWNADGVTIHIMGISAHPGMAKGKLVSALKGAADIVAGIAGLPSPESTEGRHGFVHPTSMQGTVEDATIQLIIRAFSLEELDGLYELVCRQTTQTYMASGGLTIETTRQEQYRNMKQVLDQHPHVAERALAAMRRCSLDPQVRSVRGGTDGARLSFMGLPCPNLFAGEHAFHSKTEYTSRQDMEAAVRVALEVVRVGDN